MHASSSHPRRPHRRLPCLVPCPPIGLAALVTLLDGTTVMPLWLTWVSAITLSTIGRLACRWLHTRRSRGRTTDDPEGGNRRV